MSVGFAVSGFDVTMDLGLQGQGLEMALPIATT